MDGRRYRMNDFNAFSDEIQSGDILLCSGDGLLSNFIKDATNSHYSHVAMLLRLKRTGQWLVLESVESKGVRCVTLEQGYMSSYNGSGKPYPGTLYIARYAGLPNSDLALKQMYHQAFALLGDEYNEEEIIKIARRIIRRQVGIKTSGVLLPNNKYICSEFVYMCFKAVGIEFGFDSRGFISPSNIAQDPNVSVLFAVDP